MRLLGFPPRPPMIPQPRFDDKYKLPAKEIRRIKSIQWGQDSGVSQLKKAVDSVKETAKEIKQITGA